MDVKWTGTFHAGAESFRRAHANPHYELIVAAEAPVRIAAAGRRHTLRAGESLLLAPWEAHSGWDHKEPQGTFFWVQFSCYPGMSELDAGQLPDLKIIHAERTELRTAEPPALSQRRGQSPAMAHDDLLLLPKVHLSSRRFELLGLLEKLVLASQSPGGYYRHRQTLLLGEALLLIAEDFLAQSRQNTELPASYMTYRAIVDFMNNNFERMEDLVSLERALHRKYSYLCHVFKKYAGMTIGDYLHHLRIQRAKHLLLNTERSIRRIAEEVGFKDAFYFSRIFKRIEGIPPQAYRSREEREGES